MSDFPGLVQALQLAIKAMLMYTGTHPQTRTALANLVDQIRQWLEERPNLHLATSQGKIFLDGAPFESASVHLKALVRQLTERQLSGFIIQRGVTAEELETVVGILILKPAKLEEAGGAAAILTRKQVHHVQISQAQYKEVREGDGGDEGQGGPGTRGQGDAGTAEAEASVTAAAAAAMAALAASVLPNASGRGDSPTPPWVQPNPALELHRLTEQWREQLELLPKQALVQGMGFSPASLGFLGGSAQGLGLGEGLPDRAQLEALGRALQHLPDATLLAVVAGLDSLPPAPAGLRKAFQALAPRAFAQAAAGLMASETPWPAVKEALFATLRFAPQEQGMLAALEAELRGRGLGLDIMERFQEILRQLDWESLTVEEKLRLGQEPSHFWSLNLDQRLAFLRLLLDEGRNDAFLKLLEQILSALADEDPLRRESAALILPGVTRWLAFPGLPMEAEGPLFQGLSAHFCWEPHLHIHQATTEAIDAALGALVTRGEPGHALNLLQELGNLCAFQETATPWREAALLSLQGRLADPASLRKVVELLHTANSETMLTELIPYLEAVGDPACRLLVAVLGEEPERKRRGRLIEAIRGLGEPALPALYSGLDASAWYLVRNTLNLLADLGDAEALPAAVRCLMHPDGRVKRAAVRTLWKVGGPAAVPHLLTAFPAVDPATQGEILFALGQVHSPLSVPMLAAFAQEHRAPEALRGRAAETLGQIGDASAIPALQELAKRKGRFFSTAEPTAVRLAACRALHAIGTAPALESLRAIVAAEPWDKERALLQQVLDHPV